MSWLVTPAEKTAVDRFGIGSVSLLIHGDGANGSTTILDSSPTPKTVTVVGNAQISTVQSKFGGSSIAFDGNSDYLQVSADASLDIRASDFTIELWLRFSAVSGSAHCINTSNSANIGQSIAIFRNGDSILYYLNSTLAWDVANGVSVGKVYAATWHHIALTRQGSTFRGFVDGVKGVDTISSATLAPYSSIAVGSQVNGGALQLNGYIDDLRITKGIARYTANFTPPTAPFPDI